MTCWNVKRLGLMLAVAMLGATGIVATTTLDRPSSALALSAGSTLELQVTGVAGVPSNADAVVLNMTVVNAQAPGFATVYPCGQPRPDRVQPELRRRSNDSESRDRQTRNRRQGLHLQLRHGRRPRRRRGLLPGRVRIHTDHEPGPHPRHPYWNRRRCCASRRRSDVGVAGGRCSRCALEYRRGRTEHDRRKRSGARFRNRLPVRSAASRGIPTSTTSPVRPSRIS